MGKTPSENKDVFFFRSPGSGFPSARTFCDFALVTNTLLKST